MLSLLRRVFRRKEQSLEPVYHRDRHRCPFYGFFGAPAQGVFLDQGGNQCALLTTSYSPCRMEMRGEIPNWDGCPFNIEEDSKKFLRELADSFRVFPDEFRPEGVKSWEGISFRTWYYHVMGRSIGE